MHGIGLFYLNGLIKWLKDEYNIKHNINIDTTEWTLCSKSEIMPRQQNGFDCGVYATIAADFLLDKLPLSFNLNGRK